MSEQKSSTLHSDPYATSQPSQANSPIPPALTAAQKGRTRRRRPESMLMVPLPAAGGGTSPGSFGYARPTSPNAQGHSGSGHKLNLSDNHVQVSAGKQRNGHGCFAYADGTIYEGEWLDEKQHGHGVCVFPSGNIYVGDWVQGTIEGRGAMLYSDSDLFEGHWKAGDCDGEGVFFSSGTETRGVWTRGKKVSGHTIAMSDASATLRYQTATQLIRSVSSTVFSRGTQIRSPQQGFGTATPDQTPAPHETPLQHGGNKPNRSPGEEGSLASGGDRGDSVSKQASFGLPPGGLPDLNTSLGHRDRASRAINPHASVAIEPQPLAATQASLGATITSQTNVRHTLALEDPQEMTATHQAKNPMAVGNQNPGGGKLRNNPDVLFSVAGPSYNVSFDLGKWFKYFGLFLFPYLSFPHCRCPLRVNVLDLEREYVVSGAALHLDFEQPTTAVYCAAMAVACTVFGCIAASAMEYQVSDHTRVARVDLVGPIVSVLLFAAMQAGYHSFVRVAHALERVDRKTFPRLASFAASCVDSQASICIYTWGEDGNSKVTNKHYRYRWLMVSWSLGLIVAWLSPIYRGIRGEAVFGETPVEQFTVVMCIVAAFTGINGISFYVMKITDMERQVLGQMRVLSRAAYVSGVSLLRPTDHRKIKFNLDAPLYTAKLTEGFVGWYVTRCFVLYASTCANHTSRLTAMSAFFLFVIMMALVVFGDLLYAVALGYDAKHFSVAHLIALVVSSAWGFLLLRYMYVLVMIDKERTKHMYIVDVAALVHQCNNNQQHQSTVGTGPQSGSYLAAAGAESGDPFHVGPGMQPAGPEIVSLCKAMVVHHDYQPQMLGIHVTPKFLFVVTLLTLCMIGVCIFWLILVLSS